MKLEPIVLTVIAASLVAVTVVASEVRPTTTSFTTAKKRAMEVTAPHRETFYCGCDFDAEGNVSDDKCGYVPRNMFTSSGDVNLRTVRIEWEHIVPAARMGKGRKCWEQREAFEECRTSSGGLLSSRNCCRKVDPEFKAMEADLQNLWPAIGELNADRSDKEFDTVAGEPREYGACDFETNSTVAEPRDAVLGEVARAYLYMAKVWGLKLLDEEMVQYRAWSEADPPTEWELERDRKITELQGVSNTFVSKHSHVHNGKPCTPKAECCRVCKTSQACGDACISTDKTCSTQPGCACNAAALCPED